MQKFRTIVIFVIVFLGVSLVANAQTTILEEGVVSIESTVLADSADAGCDSNAIVPNERMRVRTIPNLFASTGSLRPTDSVSPDGRTLYTFVYESVSYFPVVVDLRSIVSGMPHRVGAQETAFWLEIMPSAPTGESPLDGLVVYASALVTSCSGGIHTLLNVEPASNTFYGENQQWVQCGYDTLSTFLGTDDNMLNLYTGEDRHYYAQLNIVSTEDNIQLWALGETRRSNIDDTQVTLEVVGLIHHAPFSNPHGNSELIVNVNDALGNPIDAFNQPSSIAINPGENPNCV